MLWCITYCTTLYLLRGKITSSHVHFITSLYDTYPYRIFRYVNKNYTICWLFLYASTTNYKFLHLYYYQGFKLSIAVRQSFYKFEKILFTSALILLQLSLNNQMCCLLLNTDHLFHVVQWRQIHLLGGATILRKTEIDI